MRFEQHGTNSCKSLTIRESQFRSRTAKTGAVVRRLQHYLFSRGSKLKGWGGRNSIANKIRVGRIDDEVRSVRTMLDGTDKTQLRSSAPSAAKCLRLGIINQGVPIWRQLSSETYSMRTVSGMWISVRASSSGRPPAVK